MSERSPIPTPYEVNLTQDQMKSIIDSVRDLSKLHRGRATAEGMGYTPNTPTIAHMVNFQRKREIKMGEDILYPLYKALKDGEPAGLQPYVNQSTPEQSVTKVNFKVRGLNGREQDEELILDTEVHCLLAILFDGFERDSLKAKGPKAAEVLEALTSGRVVELRAPTQ